jgi:hypothetical protein
MSTPDRPSRVTLAKFEDYAAAQRAVDHLSDRGFPVEAVSIVGRDLRYVEHVTGRMTTGNAATIGALQGAVLGALFSLAFGLIFTFDPSPVLPLLVVYGTLAGAVLGGLFGAMSHSAGGGRDFASVGSVVADRYELLVDADVAERAAEALREIGVTTGAEAGDGTPATDGAPARDRSAV